jgi:hypothetical protein
MYARHFTAPLLSAIFFVSMVQNAHAADRSSGTFACETKPITVKFGWLVRGPNVTYKVEHGLSDLYDPKGKTALRIYFSDTDVGAELKACKNLSCTTDAIGNGFMIDFADSADLPELPYRAWIAEGDVKCNSFINPSALQLTTNKPDHLAGKLHLSEMSGTVTADVDFDLQVFNTLKTEYQFD